MPAEKPKTRKSSYQKLKDRYQYKYEWDLPDSKREITGQFESNEIYKDHYIQFIDQGKVFTTIAGYTSRSEGKDGKWYPKLYLPHLKCWLPMERAKILGRSVSKELRLEAENLRLKIKMANLQNEAVRQMAEANRYNTAYHRVLGYEYTLQRFEELLKEAPTDPALGLTSPNEKERKLTETLVRCGYYDHAPLEHESLLAKMKKLWRKE